MITEELRLNEKDKEYKKIVNNFGKDTIKKVENTSRSFGSIVDQVASSIDYSEDIEMNISNLSEIVKKLDPSGIDFKVNKGLFFNPTKKYLRKIKSKESTIKLLVDNLIRKKDILKRDNITLELEIKKLEDVISLLDVEYSNGINLKNELNEFLDTCKDNSKENYYMHNVIEPLEKKIFDLKQMAIIKEQSVLSLEIVCRNNKEIIRNLDMVQNVTLEALNTAITIANSLNNQKGVLSKIHKSDAFDSFYKIMNDVEAQNKTKLPEIRDKIKELENIKDI